MMNTKNCFKASFRHFNLNIILLFTLFILADLYPVKAQPAVFDWANSMGNVNDDKGNCIKVDVNGDIYTIGNFNDSVDFDPGTGVYYLYSSGYADVFISKSDPNGNLLWAKQFGGSVHDNGTSLALDNAGNIYATGSFANTADFDPGAGTFNMTASGGLDVFVIKLDASGNFIWAKQMGGSQISSIGGDEGKSIAIDAADHVYVAGRFEYTGDFDPGPGQFNLIASGTECDIFVLKLDDQGNFVWAKKWGSNSNGDWINSIAIDDSANVYSSGSYYSNIDFDPGSGNFNMAPGGLAGVFISKLDSSGSFVWAKQFSKQGGFLLDVGSLAIDYQGNIYTTGTFSGTVDFNPGTGANNLSAGSGSNTFVTKLTSSGSYIWAKSFGGTGEVTGIGLTTDGFGNAYIIGWFNDNNPNCDFDPGTGTYKLIAAGYLDVFISKLDPSGNFVWAKGMGGVAEDVGHSVAVDASSNVYSTGYFSNTADFDPDTAIVFNLIAVASADIFIHKMGQIGAGINELLDTGALNVFPNPANDNFSIRLPESILYGNLRIYDVYGVTILEREVFNQKQIEFNNKLLKAGLYFVEVIDQKKSYVSKIIVR